MKKCIIILTMAVMALSCERQLRQPHPVEITYTPEISVSFAGDTPAEPMLQISAYKLSGEKFLYTSQDGATFSLEGEEVPSHIAYAVYPVDGRDSLYRGVFCRDLKSEQIAISDGFDQSAMWYAGQVKDNHVTMQPTCAFLKFRIVQPDVASVKIVSKDAPLSGMYTFAMNSTVTAYSSDESLNSVTLSGDFELDGTYKAVCIPGKFKNFDVTMKNAEGFTLWSCPVVAADTIYCSQTADLGDFGNPDVATVHLSLSSDEFAGWTVKAVNLYHGSALDNVLGINTSETMVAGQTLMLKVYGVAAADYSGKKLWAVTVLEKDGQTCSVPMQIDGMNIPASETVVIDLGQLRSDVELESNDNYILYKMGRDITVGDLSVNIADYPDAELVKPSEITLSLLQAGGLIFIDDEEGTGKISLGMTSGGTYNLTNLKELILVGRYKIEGKQTEIELSNCRTIKDLSILNLRLKSIASAQLFSKNSNDKVQTALRLQDCNIDNSVSGKLVEDTQASGAASYSDVIIDNCVIKMANTKASHIFRTRNFVDETSINVSITNCVAYTTSLTDSEAAVFFIYNPDNLNTVNITLNVSNNTFLNLHGSAALIRRGAKMDDSKITIGNNLVVTDNTNTPEVKTNRDVFFVKNTSTPSAGNNFLTTINYTGDANTINKSKMQSLSKTATDKDEQTVNPFTVLDYTDGYFPVDAEVVDIGAGASYDTKYYIPQN